MKTYFLTLVLLGLSICGFGQSTTIGVSELHVGEIYRISGLTKDGKRHYWNYSSDGKNIVFSTESNKSTLDLYILRKSKDGSFYFETFENTENNFTKKGYIGYKVAYQDRENKRGWYPISSASNKNLFAIKSFDSQQGNKTFTWKDTTYIGHTIKFYTHQYDYKQNEALLTSDFKKDDGISNFDRFTLTGTTNPDKISTDYNGRGYSTFFVFENQFEISFVKTNEGLSENNDYNYYASVYYPFALYIPDDVKVMKITSKPEDKESGELSLEDITSTLKRGQYNQKRILPGSSPVLLMVSNKNAAAAPSVTKAFEFAPTQDKALENTGFAGTFTKMDMTEASQHALIYKLRKQGGVLAFYYVDLHQSFCVNANKAYYSSKTVGVVANSKLNFIFGNFDDNETTSIQPSEVSVNPNLSNEIYNLAGQKVDANYKGIVIKNGRKIVIK